MPLNKADLDAIGALISGAAITPKPWWQRIDGIGVVLAAAISALTLGTLYLTASGQTAAIKGLDDRLTPAITKLDDDVAALDKRLSVDEATTPKGKLPHG